MSSIYFILYDGTKEVAKEKFTDYTPSEDGVTFTASMDGLTVSGDVADLGKIKTKVADNGEVTVRFTTLNLAEFENIMPSLEREFITANQPNVDTARQLLEENIRKSQEALANLQ